MLPENSRVLAAVLAAGKSSRMGECKLLLPFGGTTLLERAVSEALGSQAGDVAVVTGAYADQMAPVLDGGALKVLRNSRWIEGQSTSVALAAKAAEAGGFGALLIMVADQPFVEARHLDGLIDAWRKAKAGAGESLSAAMFRTSNGEQRGNPCLFDRAWFGLLQQLSGDEGARALARLHPDQVEDVLFDAPDLFVDIDSPEDYQRLATVVVAPGVGE